MRYEKPIVMDLQKAARGQTPLGCANGLTAQPYICGAGGDFAATPGSCTVGPGPGSSGFELCGAGSGPPGFGICTGGSSPTENETCTVGLSDLN